jgi:hypothetical protein
MTRRKLLKRVAFFVGVAGLLLIASLYSYLGLSSDPGNFWRTMNGARVTLNGVSVPNARIYRRPDGMLLMNLGEGNGWQLYRPDSKNIYWCNPIEYAPMPGYIYANHCDSQFCPCVAMGSVKTDIDAQLKVEPNFIEFNSRDRQRLRVSW